MPYLRSRCRPAGTFAQDVALHKISQLAPFPPRSIQVPATTSNNGGNAHDLASGDSDDEDKAWWGEAARIAAKYDGPIQPSNKGKYISRVNKGRTNSYQQT